MSKETIISIIKDGFAHHGYAAGDERELIQKRLTEEDKEYSHGANNKIIRCDEVELHFDEERLYMLSCNGLQDIDQAAFAQLLEEADIAWNIDEGYSDEETTVIAVETGYRLLFYFDAASGKAGKIFVSVP